MKTRDTRNKKYTSVRQMDKFYPPKTVYPYKENKELLIKNFRKTFFFDQKPFDEIEDNLLYLSMVPDCSGELLERGDNQIFKGVFGTCSHQTLEFYGDKMLGMCVASISMQSLNLAANPNILTDTMSYIVNNRTLTNIMAYMGGCHYVRKYSYKIKESEKFKNGNVKIKFEHNACADMFEAIIGAIFYHFNILYGVKYASEMCELWIRQYTPIPSLLKKKFDQHEVDSNVIIFNNVEQQFNTWKYFYPNSNLQLGDIPETASLINKSTFEVNNINLANIINNIYQNNININLRFSKTYNTYTAEFNIGTFPIKLTYYYENELYTNIIRMFERSGIITIVPDMPDDDHYYYYNLR